MGSVPLLVRPGVSKRLVLNPKSLGLVVRLVLPGLFFWLWHLMWLAVALGVFCGLGSFELNESPPSATLLHGVFGRKTILGLVLLLRRISVFQHRAWRRRNSLISTFTTFQRRRACKHLCDWSIFILQSPELPMWFPCTRGRHCQNWYARFYMPCGKGPWVRRETSCKIPLQETDRAVLGVLDKAFSVMEKGRREWQWISDESG